MNRLRLTTANSLKRYMSFYYELNHFGMAITGEVAPDVSALGCLCLHANLGCALRQRKERRENEHILVVNTAAKTWVEDFLEKIRGISG